MLSERIENFKWPKETGEDWEKPLMTKKKSKSSSPSHRSFTQVLHTGATSSSSESDNEAPTTQERRMPWPLSHFKKHLDAKNSELRVMGEPLVIEYELVGLRLYTGPMYCKYNLVLRKVRLCPPGAWDINENCAVQCSMQRVLLS